MGFLKWVFGRKQAESKNNSYSAAGLWIYDPASLSKAHRATLLPNMPKDELWIMELNADSSGKYLGLHECRYSQEGDKLFVRMNVNAETESLADGVYGKIESDEVVFSYRFVGRGRLIQLNLAGEDMAVPLRLK